MRSGLTVILLLCCFIASSQSVTFKCGNHEITLKEAAKESKTKWPGIVDSSFFSSDTLSLFLNDFGNQTDTLKWNFMIIPKKGNAILKTYKGQSPWVITGINNLIPKSQLTKLIVTIRAGKKEMLPVLLDVKGVN